MDSPIKEMDLQTNVPATNNNKSASPERSFVAIVESKTDIETKTSTESLIITLNSVGSSDIISTFLYLITEYSTGQIVKSPVFVLLNSLTGAGNANLVNILSISCAFVETLYQMVHPSSVSSISKMDAAAGIAEILAKWCAGENFNLVLKNKTGDPTTATIIGCPSAILKVETADRLIADIRIANQVGTTAMIIAAVVKGLNNKTTMDKIEAGGKLVSALDTPQNRTAFQRIMVDTETDTQSCCASFCKMFSRQHPTVNVSPKNDSPRDNLSRNQPQVIITPRNASTFSSIVK